jgi:FkbM family methyltransferase
MFNRNLDTFNEAQYQIKIKHFFDKYYDISGVVHVGTNDGYELQWYRNVGIEYFVGFEPLPLAIRAFSAKYPTLATGKEFFYPYALGEKNEKRTLKITQGDGQGSSFLDEIQTTYGIVGEVEVEVRRYEDFIQEHTYIPRERYDCLVVDTQGTELEVLKGMGTYIHDFLFLNIECSEQTIYEGGASAHQIITYLSKAGFVQDSPMEIHNDIFFIHKSVL